MQNLLTLKVREYRLSLRGIYCTLPKLRKSSAVTWVPPEQKSYMSRWTITFIWYLGRPPKKCFVLIFLWQFIYCLFSSSLVGCVKSWHTYGAASCHAGHLHHRPNFGADLGGTGCRRHSNMEKVAGRTPYILIILCSGLDSILRALWGGSTPFFAFIFLYNFYSGDWLKI